MQCVTAIVAIDLSEAFDTVDHNILLEVLHKQFGTSLTALNWYDSYLQPRSFKVNVGSAYSIPRFLTFSVPQGSCAGPMLYSCYASTTQEVVPDSVDIHGYADDHVLKQSFHGSLRDEEKEIIQKLEQSITDINKWMVKTDTNKWMIKTDINKWMDKNRLKMNSDKTEFYRVKASVM